MSYRQIFIRFICFTAIIYTLACCWVYFNQEELLFHPDKLDKSHTYSFTSNFEEFSIPVSDKNTLNALLFKAENSNGQVILFLHGNAGNMEDQDGVALFYTKLGYDFMTYDYRGFGKSTGAIESEVQFLADAQAVYNTTGERYTEDKIIIIGYSIGTGAASWLAMKNHPSKLALMAPYYSMSELASHHYPLFPNFILKYKFKTSEYLKKVEIPVCLFHGKNDETIPFNSSKKLAGLLRNGDRFVPLDNQKHGGFEQHPTFKKEMKCFLSQD